MEDLETSDLASPKYPPPPKKIGTSLKGPCVVDWCVDITAVSAKDTISFWSNVVFVQTTSKKKSNHLGVFILDFSK